MDFHYVVPPVPTVARWRDITGRFRGLSVLRMLQYEFLCKLPISGKVLDMGGGQKAKYLHLLPKGLEMSSVNIDPGISPTHLVQPGQTLPFSDGSFDSVICLNTLEHIYDAPAVLSELRRVVKTGGCVHVTVPFMFRIHGHPDDYFRATPSWWREAFARAGFSALEFHPLVWGRSSTASVVPGRHGAFVRARMHLAMLFDVLTARLLLSRDGMTGRRGESICGISPGWFMTGTK
ncbi:class I SAM-dependent methyltransferase [Albidovulum sp.]|uniref:class I SAM-dependent methyltransferase n=1 Tax=Albidovulum sp. TaxID=1872424 RepID=UPI0039B84272